MNRFASLFWLLALWLGAAGALQAAETIPPKPTQYFNDYPLTVKSETTDQLNRKLEDFERQTSNQILVAIFPKMLSDSSVDDYTQRVARAWQVGQKNSNGAVLFVFVADHKTFIQVGPGLEGPLPDSICKDITADVIAPRFKSNDYDGGLTAGVEAIMQAVRGEYKGSGRTVYEKQQGNASGGSWGFSGVFVFIALAFFINYVFRNRRGGTVFGGSGPMVYYGSGGLGSFGGGSGGGSSSSGGGGNFSSGGGDFTGGGAGSDW